MPTPPPRSLMDNVEFLGELERMEQSGPATPILTPAAPSAMDRLDDGLDHGFAAGHTDAEDWSNGVVFNGQEGTPEPEGASALEIALQVGGFLMLMAIGAAAAVWVFHDRVALIFR